MSTHSQSHKNAQRRHGIQKREKILTYMSTLGTKSEMQYFAQSFPTNLKFDDGVNIRQYLITVTQ